MKSYKELNRLADLFEYKLKKYAEEMGDSTLLTMSFRPAANAVIEANANKVLAPVQSLVMKKMQAAANANTSISGNIVVGGKMFTSAKKAGGKWVVTKIELAHPITGFIVKDKTGQEVTDPEIVVAVERATQNFVLLLIPALSNELNRMAANMDPAADTITRHESDVNSKEFGP